MKLLLLSIALLCTAFLQSFTTHSSKQRGAFTPVASQKIQVAILLDVSNSMDGLIEQAKAQLWNMVNTVGKAKCATGSPQIEIALYEYGRSSNNLREGYVKQISPFTKDLDLLSDNLFKLTTNGGDEYCGQVIYTSLQQLKWDNAPNTYKVIFIAGNEDFYQGSISWSVACAEARKKGVIVNTIYCGNSADGLREHWNLGAECGNGSYTNINQNAKVDDIPTPYDSAMFVLNEKLNKTYIAYGYQGMASARKQEDMDKANYSMSKSVMAERVAVKGKNNLYKNEQWDLVDAAATDSAILQKVDIKTLPAELKNKSRSDIKKVVQEKATDRSKLQSQIAKLSAQRENYIAAERKKKTGKKETTLESEVQKIIKQQVRRYNMVID